MTALCGVGLALVIMAGIAKLSAQRQAARGVVQGFPEPVAYAGVPRLGINVALERYDADELVAVANSTLAPMLGGELGWIRQTFRWGEIEPEPGRFEWERWDAVFDTLDQLRHAQSSAYGGPLALAVLDSPPAWLSIDESQRLHSPALPKGSEHIDVSASQQTQALTINNFQLTINNYSRFAGEFAARYGDRVDYYQIWDEPNLGDKWGGQVEPVAYAEMLRQAGDAIRANDPGAVIVLAGLAPTTEQSSTNMADWLFLRRLYEIGAKDYFDIAAGKPYGFYTGPDDRRVDPAVLNFSHILLMREEMEKHGDESKPLWATQWGWYAVPEDWPNAPEGWGGASSAWGQVSQEQQAEYTAAAIRRAASEWPWMGVLLVENLQPGTDRLDEPRWGFAAAWQDGTPRPLYHALVASAAELSPPGVGYYPAAVRAGGSYTSNPTATFEGQWRFGELGADWQDESGARVSLDFRGTGLALRVRRAADRAHLYVTVDGQPANALPRDDVGAFLQLIPPDFSTADIATVAVARGLQPALHHAEITTERGWNQWALVGWSVENQLSMINDQLSNWALVVLGLVCLAGVVWNGRRVEWGRLGRAASAGYGRLGEATQVALTLLAAGVMYLAAAMTWGQETSAAFRRLGDGAGIAAVLGASALFYFSPWLILTVLSGLALFGLILLRLELGLALAVLCAPFFFLPRALFERAFSMAEVVTLMCFASWIRSKVSGSRFQVPGSRFQVSRFTFHVLRFRNLKSLDWAVLAFVVLSIASLFIADYPHVAVRELRVIVLEPALLYLMLRTTLPRRPPGDMWRVVDALALGGALVAIIGLLQYGLNVNLITAEEGARRLRAVYGSPNNAALFLGRVLPVLVAVALVGRGKRKGWYALATGPVALAILLTFSKGALLLGVPASMAVLLLLWQGRRAWGWLAGLAVVGAAGFAALLRLPQIGARLGLSSDTSFFRLSLWKSAVAMIWDHPLWGVGLDNFLYAYRGRYMRPEAWAEPSLSHAHNVLLDYATRLGLVGLATAAWMQVEFWARALPLRRSSDPMSRALAIGLMASMVDFLAHGLVDASFFVVDLAYVFFVTLALVQVLGAVASTAKE
ncbi:MAG: O-antigen ligase family protein [Thermoflexales bacterium]|nr:O-antigen ligase family protein [Thermoflexales bacterium]